MSSVHSVHRRVVLTLAAASAAPLLFACGTVPELPVPGEVALPGLSRLTQPEPAVTTSLADALTEAPFLDDFDPGEPGSLNRLPRNERNGFVLTAPGFYTLATRSYCLHAGSYAPSGGDGYLYAPLKGPRAPLIRRLVQNSVDHPEIPQEDVQALIWAILARASLRDASPEMQLTAARLLSQEDLDALDAVALDVVSGALREQALAHLPEPALRALEAEAQLRELFAAGQSTYEELEEAAVLFGVAPPAEGDRKVPEGRWSYHPDGYFVRYFPSSYQRTEVQLYVPERFTRERDALGRITAIADPQGNRLEVEYEDAAAPLRIPGEAGLSAHRIRAVRRTRYLALGPEMGRVEVETIPLSGWTFLGAPAAGGLEAGALAPEAARAFPGLEERYRAARRRIEELAEVSRRASKMRDRGSEPSRSLLEDADLVDLVHLDAALRAAEPRSGGEGGTGEWLNVPTKAWLGRFVHPEERLSARAPAVISAGGSGRRLAGPGVPNSPLQGSEPRPATAGRSGPRFAVPLLPGGPPASPAPGGSGGWAEPWTRETANPWNVDSGSPADPWTRMLQPLLSDAPPPPFNNQPSEGICDDLPGPSEGQPTYDPTDGTATPGQTASQRLLPSAYPAGEPDPDCGKVGDILDGMKKVRDAYASNPPRAGESGPDYARRIEGGIFGYGQEGGAISPMGTDMGSCVILGNRSYYDSQPPIVRSADCAHEQVHQSTCRWARDHAAGGYQGWAQDPENYRQNELDAYAASIKALEDWMNANGCKGQ